MIPSQLKALKDEKEIITIQSQQWFKANGNQESGRQGPEAPATKLRGVARLNRTQHAVLTKLLEEPGRYGWLRFDGGIPPGLNAQGLRRAACVTQTLPDRFLPDYLRRQEKQGSLTLQVLRGAFHFGNQDLQGPLDRDAGFNIQVSGAGDQVFHLPTHQTDQLFIGQEQQEGLFTNAAMMSSWDCGWVPLARRGDQGCDIGRIPGSSTLDGQLAIPGFVHDNRMGVGNRRDDFPGCNHLLPGIFERPTVLNDHIRSGRFHFLGGLGMDALQGILFRSWPLLDQTGFLDGFRRVRDPDGTQPATSFPSSNLMASITMTRWWHAESSNPRHVQPSGWTINSNCCRASGSLRPVVRVWHGLSRHHHPRSTCQRYRSLF